MKYFIRRIIPGEIVDTIGRVTPGGIGDTF